RIPYYWHSFVILSAAKNPLLLAFLCHSERSEESLIIDSLILRFFGTSSLRVAEGSSLLKMTRLINHSDLKRTQRKN
ncbi:MAG TPA: hypothetical protein PLN03_07850, partial [Spirochaetota bacterium]|nr:hypothetical protein [Spirochaetota bacterium]